jgi:tetratricopeptide (TPR) repeat protein
MMSDRVVPHLLHALLAAATLGMLYAWGITPEVMSANGWWWAFLVANAGVLAGNLAMAALPASPGDSAAVTAEGRRQDLLDSHATVVELLRNLEVERPKLDPADYDRQREALVAVGAAALRALEEEAPAASATGADPVEAVLAQLRALRAEQPASFDAAVARLGLGPAEATGVSGEWRGALYTLVLVAIAGGLWVSVQDSAKQRAPGMSMTGGDQPEAAAGPAGAPPAADPRIAELQAELATNPSDLDGWNRLTELTIGVRDLATAMDANQRALALGPNDPDALVYRAVLKAFIGRVDEAIAELEAAAAAHPNHARAFIYQGLLLMERNPGAAVVALEKAATLDDSPQLKEALAVARQRASGAPPMPPTAAPPAAAPASSGAVLASGTVTLAPGAATAGAVLFVNLKDPAGGPPIAAVKLPPGPFPATFRISESDRLPMSAGRPLPAKLTLTARLDSDGDAMSRPETDPSATADVAPGAEGLTLELR